MPVLRFALVQRSTGLAMKGAIGRIEVSAAYVVRSPPKTLSDIMCQR